MTEHMAIAIVRNGWGHSESERREAALIVCEGLETVTKERDALAAHVEDVRDTYGQMVAGLSGNDERSARLVAVGRVLNQSPTTSLARLKAQWQAEVLREAAHAARNSLAPSEKIAAWIDRYRLRRQAEEKAE